MNLIALNFGSSSSTFFTSVATAVFAGVILFLLNWGRELITAYTKRSSEAKVLAFSISTQLDRLVTGCADVVNDPLPVDQKTGFVNATATTPKISFDDGLPWHVFPLDLQHRIRSLPNRIDVADRSLMASWEYGDGDDIYDQREEEYARIGLEALELVQELARDYHVPKLDRRGWDPDFTFRETIMKYDERHRLVAEAVRGAQSFSWAELGLPTPIEELEKRRALLDTALRTAQAKFKPGNSVA